jgi:hypothetical protein
LLGLGRYTEAAEYAKRWLRFGIGVRKYDAIAIFALIYGQTQQYQHCAELLGICQNASILGWLPKWSLTHDVIHKAKQELGADAYNAAWERGKSLDLETVVQDLLDESEEDA